RAVRDRPPHQRGRPAADASVLGAAGARQTIAVAARRAGRPHRRHAQGARRHFCRQGVPGRRREDRPDRERAADRRTAAESDRRRLCNAPARGRAPAQVEQPVGQWLGAGIVPRSRAQSALLTRASIVLPRMRDCRVKLGNEARNGKAKAYRMLQSTIKPGTAPSGDELLRRARALVPVVQERAAKAEELRRCPDETIQDFLDLDLLRICQPARYGGFELGYDVLCEVSQTLARGCGSQAWVHMVLADNTLKLASYSAQA